MGCMRDTNGAEICPYCGFSLKWYEKEKSPRVLPALTILKGKYLVGKVLGEGGFGITYLAFDLNLQISVAIKEYFPVGLASRDTSDGKTEAVSLLTGAYEQFYQMGLESFVEEARSLTKCREVPGVVSVNDFFYENKTAYLAMDYIRGKSLKKYLRENGNILPEKEVLQMMRPVLDALVQIHKHGIIHRDISAENIMLGDDGEISLIDFGAARMAAGAETKSLTVLLKHGYAPVEQYQTKGKQGPWTDIYAVCATMYGMLSGALPDEAIERMVEDKVLPLEKISGHERGIKISHRVSKAIQKGLEVRPENRYQRVEELIFDLYGESTDYTAGSRNYVNRTYKNTENNGIELVGTESKTKKAHWKTLKMPVYLGMVFSISITIFLLFMGIKVVKEYTAPKLEKEERAVEQKSDQTETISEETKEGHKEKEEALLSEFTPTPSPLPTPIPDSEANVIPVLETVLSKIPLQVINAKASSTIRQDGVDNSPMLMFDGIESTSWQEGVNGHGIGEKVYAQFDDRYFIEHLTFRMGNWKTEDYYTGNNRPKTLRITLGDEETDSEQTFDIEFPDGKELFCVEFTPHVLCSYMTIEIRDVYAGTKWDDTAIAEIGFYGSVPLNIDMN